MNFNLNELKEKKQIRQEKKAEHKAMAAEYKAILRKYADDARKKAEELKIEFDKFAMAHDISSDTDFVLTDEGRYVYNPGFGRKYNSNKALTAIEYNQKLEEFNSETEALIRESSDKAYAEFLEKYGEEKVSEYKAIENKKATIFAVGIIGGLTILIIGLSIYSCKEAKGAVQIEINGGITGS